ncbi:phosphoribosylglycinamide formyltransferase [Pelagibius sp. Alg239-R121]|uniref:phosphoribosylglycinamide formyltransferase n=1 Tax=Pelagibius sp. Alg239-R121 TaxID=2993448 RepID=UPI0024A730D6|nr:phosphoribosylglycinamide formyltransferase [Pelagibius sp. Alg239-R121]
MTNRLKVGVVISGRGSNLQALLDACTDPAYPAEIVRVISNNPDVEGLRRAERAGVATETINHRAFENRESFERSLSDAMEAAGVELICHAGFMRIVTGDYLSKWHNRLINIHPSLLPAFPGLNTHKKALDAGVKLHGCTVHYVREEVDVGPIIGQAAVPVLDGDSEDSLADRVLTAEHKLYPLCLRLVAEGRVLVDGDRAIVKYAGPFDPNILLSPAS